MPPESSFPALFLHNKSYYSNQSSKKTRYLEALIIIERLLKEHELEELPEAKIGEFRVRTQVHHSLIKLEERMNRVMIATSRHQQNNIGVHRSVERCVTSFLRTVTHGLWWLSNKTEDPGILQICLILCSYKSKWTIQTYASLLFIYPCYYLEPR